MRHLRRALAAMAIATVGCSTVRPIDVPPTGSVTTPSYSAGRAVQSVPASPDLVPRAMSAMEDVGIHSIVQRREDQATVLEGRTATGRRALVSIHPAGPNAVVGARFGALGDEPLSRAFLDRLNAGEVATQAARPDPVARRPPPNRASTPAASMVQKELEGGYRDSVAP